MFSLDPIGYFHSQSCNLYDVSRQPTLQTHNRGMIFLKPKCQFEQALEGLEGFDRIWVLFRFHRHTHWKPKVLPPSGGPKRGVFATRSPHRPNFIGLSCVELLEVKGLRLILGSHDLIDGTPILDIKPYLNYADSQPAKRQGWLEGIAPPPALEILWSSQAKSQRDYLASEWNCHLCGPVEHRLSQSPFPSGCNRVKEVGEGRYELAYRTWRIYYEVEGSQLFIHSIASGYDFETLEGKKSSKWDDVPIHQAFSKRNFWVG